MAWMGHDVCRGDAGEITGSAPISGPDAAKECHGGSVQEGDDGRKRVRIPVVFPLPDSGVAVGAERGAEKSKDRGAVSQLRGADDDSHREAVYRNVGEPFAA